jgi:hypothetical protein
MLRQRCLLALVMAAMAFTIVTFLKPKDADAIPAFARRYKISCSTCHAPFPKLKHYGNEFAGNGFYIPEEEKERDYVTAGDDLLWLPRNFPLAVRFDAYGVYDEGTAADTDFQIPWGMKILSGGSVYRSIGYYFYFYLTERGEVSGIEDAYVHFNDIGGVPFDIMVGQFQTSDPLMKRELRLTYEDYMIYKLAVGYSAINLAYDRGLMLTYGIDATGTDLVGLLVNGNGKPVANEETQQFDNDKYKNAALRVYQAIGEYGGLGGFFYYGKESMETEETLLTNEVTYWGVDFNAAGGPFELTFQYLLRTDTDPFALDDYRDIDTGGIIAELICARDRMMSRNYLTLLYNRIDCQVDKMDYETLTASYTYVLARNVRLMAELTNDFISHKNRLVLGIVSGF